YVSVSVLCTFNGTTYNSGSLRDNSTSVSSTVRIFTKNPETLAPYALSVPDDCIFALGQGESRLFKDLLDQIFNGTGIYYNGTSNYQADYGSLNYHGTWWLEPLYNNASATLESINRTGNIPMPRWASSIRRQPAFDSTGCDFCFLRCSLL
ncbi:hypothetical protein H2201_006521, partial [Coniosporium apollinis]